jgi:hypothetical protein
MKRRILPNKNISDIFDEFVKEQYGEKEFPQFEATQKFFQWFFNTDLKLNDVKNMIGYVKKSDKYEFTYNDGKRNYYKRG